MYFRNASTCRGRIERRRSTVSAEASPTARALLALELLQSSPGISATRLGERLGVTERAARRYVAVLREAGIPIESVRGPYGGYRVGRGLRLPPLVFRPAEALGLVMAALDGHHDANDPTDPVRTGLGKPVPRLPPPVPAQADAARRTTAPAPDPPAPRPHHARDPGPGVLRAPAGPARLPLRAWSAPDPRRRPVGGRGASRPVVPGLPLALGRRRAHLPGRPGGRGRGARGHLRAAGGP